MKRDKNINKLAVMLVVSVFALTGAGAGYAMWSDTTTVNASVETGEVDWCFVPILSIEDDSCPPPYHPTPTPDWNCDPDYGFFEISDGEGWGPLPSDKNVGCGELVQIDCHTIEVTINNAYPGYWNGVQTHVENTGTIPLKIQEVILSWNADGTDVIAVLNTLNEFDVFHIDLDKDGNMDMELKWGDNFGNQFEPGDKPEISWEFCFLQPLPQASSFTMYATLRAVQWNEYIDP